MGLRISWPRALINNKFNGIYLYKPNATCATLMPNIHQGLTNSEMWSLYLACTVQKPVKLDNRNQWLEKCVYNEQQYISQTQYTNAWKVYNCYSIVVDQPGPNFIMI